MGMLDTFDYRFGSVPLCSVVFFDELPVVLGVSAGYVRRLVSGSLASCDPVFARLAFPKPWFVSSSGVRVWRVRDLESWVLGVRSRRSRGGVDSFGGLLLERRALANKVLGLQ